MSVQTSYGQSMPVAVAGMLGDMRDHVIESFAAEGITGFGLAVVKGTDGDKQAKLPATGGLEFRGVTVRAAVTEQVSGQTTAYADKAAMDVLRRGLIWVQTAGAVAQDAPAFFVNTGGDKGKFDDLDDSTTDAVPGGVFRSATSGADIALLEINLPQSA